MTTEQPGVSAMSAELGPLPEPYKRQWINCPFTERLLFTEDQMRAYAAQAVAAERERLCAEIKAADDKAVSEADYMLDSDDCISVIRGTWNPGA